MIWNKIYRDQVFIGLEVASKCLSTLPEPGWISEHFEETVDPTNTLTPVYLPCRFLIPFPLLPSKPGAREWCGTCKVWEWARKEERKKNGRNFAFGNFGGVGAWNDCRRTRTSARKFELWACFVLKCTQCRFMWYSQLMGLVFPKIMTKFWLAISLNCHIIYWVRNRAPSEYE